MKWKMKYFIINLLQKLMGSIPFGYTIQERIKAARSHWESRVPKGSMLQNLEKRIERFNRNNISPPSFILEQGTGWTGSDLVMFFLGGSQKIITYDTRPWLNEILFKQAIKEFTGNPKMLYEWEGIDNDLLTKRIEILKSSVELSLSDLLKLMCIDYRVSNSFEYDGIIDDSIDLFYSYSVLQRVKPKDLEKIFQRSYSFLKKSGSSFHRIHSVDFHAITDKRIPKLYYLRIGKPLWSLMTSKFINYQNRMRIREFCDLFQSLGFSSTLDQIECSDTDVQYAKKYLLTLYPKFTAEEVAIWQADILLKHIR